MPDDVTIQTPMVERERLAGLRESELVDRETAVRNGVAAMERATGPLSDASRAVLVEAITGPLDDDLAERVDDKVTALFDTLCPEGADRDLVSTVAAGVGGALFVSLWRRSRFPEVPADIRAQSILSAWCDMGQALSNSLVQGVTGEREDG